MSQADAKPLPFVYQFMAGKSRFLHCCSARARELQLFLELAGISNAPHDTASFNTQHRTYKSN